MSIDLTRFVDISIKYRKSPSRTATRDTVILFTTEDGIVDGTVYTSATESEIPSAATVTRQFASVYFDNGGIKLMVKKPAGSTLAASDVEALPNESIVIAYAIADNYSAMKAVSKELAADTGDYDPSSGESAPKIYGPKKKILLARASTVAKEEEALTDNIAVKYSAVTGAEMTIAAYLSQIDASVTNSVYDYMFTAETLADEDLSEDEYTIVLANQWNVDVELANAVRNIGGNLMDGSNLVNEYMLILLQQTTREALVNLLVSKISGMRGLSAIYSTLSQELNRYVACGYLATDRVWTYDDWSVTYNDESYTVIEKGTALTQGYSIMMVPYIALTEDDRKLGKAPPIYVALATSYGIRKITVGGEVI